MLRSRCRVGTCACRTALREQSLHLHRSFAVSIPAPALRTTWRFPRASMPRAPPRARAPPRRSRSSTPIYQGMQTVLGAAPNTNFPALIVDWGTPGRRHFFHGRRPRSTSRCSPTSPRTPTSSTSTSSRTSSATTSNTTSRAPTTSAVAHGLGDKLDPRVAFGEGFGYAFAAIVLNDPVARDSFVEWQRCDQWSGIFNVETNPPTNP